MQSVRFLAGAQDGEVLNGTMVVSKLCMLAAFWLP